MLAKLLDVPILMWVREHGLDVPDLGGEPIALRTVEHHDLVLTYGVQALT